MDRNLGIFMWGLFGNIFSRGVHKLHKAFNDGDDILTSWSHWKPIADGFVRPEVPKFIIGHSMGARSAIKMANQLTDEGHTVKVVICLDYVEGIFAPKLVPNGKYPVYNFRSKDWRAKDLDGAINLYRPNLRHTQIDKDPKVHLNITELLKGHL